MRWWTLFAASMLLVGSLVGALSGCAHDPNHDINMEEARKAADRIHPRPKAGTKMEPGHGG